MKPALQAALRVFGLCGSCVVLVWFVLWFLVPCGFWFWSARPIVLMWFLWVGGLALDARCSMLDARCRRLRVRSCSCGFLSRVIVSILEIVDKDINVPGYHGNGTCGFCGSVVLPSMPMLDADGCASSCSLWSDKKFCPFPRFVLCSVSSRLEATFTNGENDHG